MQGPSTRAGAAAYVSRREQGTRSRALPFSEGAPVLQDERSDIDLVKKRGGRGYGLLATLAWADKRWPPVRRNAAGEYINAFTTPQCARCSSWPPHAPCCS